MRSLQGLSKVRESVISLYYLERVLLIIFYIILYMDDEMLNIYAADEDEEDERFMDEFGNLIDPDEIVVSDEDPLLADDEDEDEPLPLDIPLTEDLHAADAEIEKEADLAGE